MIKTIQQTLILLLCILMPSISKGGIRTVDDAKEVAAEFFQSGVIHQMSDKDSLILEYTVSDGSSQPICYVFNARNGKGFVIISADENSMPVIGYSGATAWNVNFVPDAAKEIISAPVVMSADSRRKVAQMHAGGIESQLLETPSWSQESPFNNKIPNRRRSGSVGTALAEILKYHGYPAVRPASLVSDGDSNSYEWGLMRNDNYRSGYSEQEANAVATLVADAAIAIGTDFGQSSSSAFEVKVPYALTSLFGYDSGVSYKKRSELSKSAWDNVIVNEINEGRPVLYSGQDVSSGHAFVCDGYEIRGGVPYFHINWGWGGSANGYFASDALNPVVSKAHSYNDLMTIIYNIKPAANSIAWSDIHVTSDECQPGLTLDVENIGSSFTVRAGALKNISNSDFSGKLAVALFDAAGNQKCLLSNSQNFSLWALQVHKYVNYNCSLPAGTSVADGDVVRLVTMANGSSEWLPVAGDLLAPGEVPATGYSIPYISVSLPESSADAVVDASSSYVIKGRDFSFRVVSQNVDNVITVKANGFILTPDASNRYSIINVLEDQKIDILVQNASDVLSKKTMWVSAGNLQNLLTEQESATITDLTLFGSINAIDFNFMRDRMKLQRLDISQVSIVANGSNPANAIPTKAFNGYRSLKQVILPNSLTTFKNGCFAQTGLTSIEVPANVGTWEYNVFVGCNQLREVIVRRSSPAWINWCVFNGTPQTKLVVPVGATPTYVANKWWLDFKEFVEENSVVSDYFYLTVAEQKGLKFTLLTDGTEFARGSKYQFSVETDGSNDDAIMQVFANSTQLYPNASGIYEATINSNTLIHVEFKQPQATTVDTTWKLTGDAGGIGLVTNVVNVPFQQSFTVRANAIKVPKGDDAAKFYGMVLTDKNGAIKEFISSILSNYYSRTGENLTYNFSCKVKEAPVKEGNQIRLATSYNKKDWQLVDAEAEGITDRIQAVNNPVVYHNVIMPTSVTGARIEGASSEVVRGMPLTIKASAINPAQRVTVAVNGVTHQSNVTNAVVSIPAVLEDLDVTITVKDADAGDYMVYNIQEGLLAEKLGTDCPTRVKLIGNMLLSDFNAIRANASTIIDLDMSEVTIKGAAMTGNSIPENAFAPSSASALSSLKTIILPNNLERIDKNAYARCTQITEIIIPAGVSYIGDGAFSACTSLTKIDARPKVAPTCGKTSPFPSSGLSKISLVVPKGSEESYSVPSTWWSMLPLYKAPTEAKDYYWVKVDRSRMAVRDYKGDLNNVPIGSADFDLIFELPNCQQSRFKVEYQTHIRTGVAFKIYDNGVDVMANLNSFQFQPNSYTYVYPVQHWSSTAGLFGVRFIHSATSGPWVPQNHEVDLKFFYSINFENKEGAEGVTAEVVDVPDECKWYNVKMADFQNQVLNSYGRPTSNTEVKPVLYREGTDIKFQLSDVAPKTDLVVEMMTKVMTKSGPTPEYEERETILKSDNGVYTIPALAGDTWIRISGIRSYEEGDPIPASALENLDKEDVLAYSELTITGEVNEEQFEMIRDKFEGLESLDLTQINNESIPEGAFEGMNQLKDVIVSETVTEIGAGAFKDCENIESLTLPGVTTIGEGAFDGCDNLTSILLPSLGSAQASGKSGIRKAGGIDGVSVESFRGLNPNCLIYVGSVDIPNSESLNVILNVDGTRVAASDIVLDGSHSFNAPASFMLGDHQISYTADITASDACDIDGGWTTIMVPFAPTDIIFGEEIGNREGSGLHLLSFDDENSEVLTAQTSVLSNRPYLANICAPYASVPVTFTAKSQGIEGVYDVPFTPVPEETVAVGKTYSLYGSYDGETRLGELYVLNSEGSKFIRVANDESSVAPFSAYLCANNSVAASEMAIGEHPLWIHDPVSVGTGTDLYRSSLIELASPSEKASIYYTIDGSDPTVADGARKLYSAPFAPEGESTTVKAVAEYKGNVSDPVSFNFQLKKVNVDYNLTGNWNWISHVYEDAVLVADFASEGISSIISQTQEVIRDPKYGLVGSLTELLPVVGYKVCVDSESWTGNVAGVAFDPSNTIKLNRGWNWIGTPVDKGHLLISDLFSDLTVEEGDMIVGLDGFSQVDSDGLWQGSLTNMLPGEGYMFFSNSEKEFSYNLSSQYSDNIPVKAPVIAADGSWYVDNHKYASVMPVVAQLVEGNGYLVDAADYEVAAFCGDECRGIGIVANGYVMINIHGNPGDQIKFRIISDLNIEKESTASIIFDEDLISSFASPCSINISNTVAVDTVKADNFGIYSEDGKLLISGDISSIESIEVYDVAGVMIAKAVKDNAHNMVVKDLDKGVVTVVVRTDAGSFSKKMILK